MSRHPALKFWQRRLSAPRANRNCRTARQGAVSRALGI